MFSMENSNELSSKIKNKILNKQTTLSPVLPDIKSSSDKIALVFKIKYEESYHNILCEDQRQFLHSISFNSIQLLKELLPIELFANPSIKETIKTQETLNCKEYTKDYKFLSSSWNDYDMNLKALMKYSQQLSVKNNDHFSFLKQFRKHCANSGVLATHLCSKSSKLLEVTDKNDNISHVICTECKRAYLSSSIELYCFQCKSSYVSSILPPNENPDIQQATWEQYHCGVFFNQTMKCIKCRNSLYLNTKTSLLMCLNKKCNFLSKPNSIMWNCIFCKKDFKSEAKIYNALEFELIKKEIKIALILQKKGYPNELTCCREGLSKTISELSSIDFIHKTDCNGILYKGTLNNKDIIVCNKCHGMNYYDKFLWTCPFCHMRIKAKLIQQNQFAKEDAFPKSTKKNCLRASNEIFSPQKIKHDISSIVSPNHKESNKKKKYTTLIEILEKRDKKYLKIINSSNRTDRDEVKVQNENYAPLETEPSLNNNINNRDSNVNENSNEYNKIHFKDYNETEYDDINHHNYIQTEQNIESKKPISNEDTLEKIRNESNIPPFALDNFEIVKKVGEGSFGKIYLVKNKTTKQSFALKKIIAHALSEIKQFKQEFELVYSAQHKNVMKIFNIDYKSLDFSTYSIYVLMELANNDWNSEIQSRINAKHYYQESEIMNILKQLASSLSYLQKKSISHRDIKPQNVLIYDNSIYKVADFGEAKELKISKSQSTLKGTELYMSPSLYGGLKQNLTNVVHNPYKSDVFSLGYCVLYASTLSFSLLTDIREVNDMKKLSTIISKNFKGKYSNLFLNLIMKMLEVDESKRYDCIMLEKALENI